MTIWRIAIIDDRPLYLRLAIPCKRLDFFLPQPGMCDFDFDFDFLDNFNFKLNPLCCPSSYLNSSPLSAALFIPIFLTLLFSLLLPQLKQKDRREITWK